MEYQELPLSCECGTAPKRILSVGLSIAHELVIQWRCSVCRKGVCVVMPLSECWRDCPTPVSVAVANFLPTVETPDDLMFLHSLGVKYGDD
jgi:hypothetical protein